MIYLLYILIICLSSFITKDYIKQFRFLNKRLKILNNIDIEPNIRKFWETQFTYVSKPLLFSNENGVLSYYVIATSYRIAYLHLHSDNKIEKIYYFDNLILTENEMLKIIKFKSFL